MTLEPEQPLIDIIQLQIPGLEGVWRDALLITEDMIDRLCAVASREQADDLIPHEILVNPHQLALELEDRQLERGRSGCECEHSS
jgi:hypothetical protein